MARRPARPTDEGKAEGDAANVSSQAIADSEAAESDRTVGSSGPSGSTGFGRSDRTTRAPRPVSAFDVALRFLAQRPRSEMEIRRRLRRAGIEEAEIEPVLVRLRQHGVADDVEFARYWAEQRQTFKPRGAKLLRAELRQHGIDATAADAAAATVVDSAADDAYRAAGRRARVLSRTDERVFKARLGQFLARRGFDWETVAQTTDRLWSETTA